MATINQLRRERLAYYRELKRKLRPVDSAVQAMERQIERILQRTRDVPDNSDFQETVDLYNGIFFAMVEEGLDAEMREGEFIFDIERRPGAF